MISFPFQGRYMVLLWIVVGKKMHKYSVYFSMHIHVYIKSVVFG